MPAVSSPTPLRLRLPATSANLGPGFDALGLAMGLYLSIDADTASGGTHRISATGRDAGLCASLKHNLILDTYAAVVSAERRSVRPLDLTLRNEIPLGMGCGSSAAALLAGVFLANHFGELGWSSARILDEACRREGHPDNVAACFHGGMTASASVAPAAGRPATVAASFGADLGWQLILALPTASLSTSKARALLPPSYTRSDAVTNIQSTALLVSAFALDRPDLLAAAMRDCIHQPFRASVCPLLPALLPLTGQHGIKGVALSGAGPSVLLIAHPGAPADAIRAAVQAAAGSLLAELIFTTIAHGAEAVVCLPQGTSR